MRAEQNFGFARARIGAVNYGRDNTTRSCVRCCSNGWTPRNR